MKHSLGKMKEQKKPAAKQIRKVMELMEDHTIIPKGGISDIDIVLEACSKASLDHTARCYCNCEYNPEGGFILTLENHLKPDDAGKDEVSL